MSPSTQPAGRLLADIGGTNARFAYQPAPGEAPSEIRVLPVADFPRIDDAVRHYLDGLGPRRVQAAAIAIANPVTGDELRMTNHHWSFSQRALREAMGWSQLRVVNDFTALAMALPLLPSEHLRRLGGAEAVPRAACALLGAGTGLGVSGLLPSGEGGWVPIEGEGGHVTLPAATPRERLVMDALARRHGRASAERVCSGPGLRETFHILCEADGVATHGVESAADVSAAALQHGHPQALEALQMFCALLGSVAGNLALTLGARGGVYLGGGIVPRLGDWFHRSPFRTRFEDKGRFAEYLGRIPVWVITARESPALLGAAACLDAWDGLKGTGSMR